VIHVEWRRRGRTLLLVTISPDTPAPDPDPAPAAPEQRGVAFPAAAELAAPMPAPDTYCAFGLSPVRASTTSR